MAAKKKCKVVFREDRYGTDAILQPRTGTASLNLMHLGKKPTAARKRSARARLLRGCAELLRTKGAYSDDERAYNRDLQERMRNRPFRVGR